MCQNLWWALELLWCPSERSKHTSQQEDFKSQVWGAWWEVRVCWGRCATMEAREAAMGGAFYDVKSGKAFL